MVTAACGLAVGAAAQLPMTQPATINPGMLQGAKTLDPTSPAVLAARMEKLEATVAALQGRVQSLQTANETLSTQLKTTTANLTALDKAYQGHDHYFTAVQTPQDRSQPNFAVLRYTTIPTVNCQRDPANKQPTDSELEARQVAPDLTRSWNCAPPAK